MDIQSSLADFAVLSARLADPFGDRTVVLGAANTDEARFQRAAQHWSARFLERPADAEQFAHFFCEARHPRSAIGAPRAVHEVGRVPLDPDRTILAPPEARTAVLPFQDGTFQPAPIVMDQKERKAADPDATQVPFFNPDDTLPFPKPTPAKRKT